MGEGAFRISFSCSLDVFQFKLIAVLTITRHSNTPSFLGAALQNPVHEMLTTLVPPQVTATSLKHTPEINMKLTKYCLVFMKFDVRVIM